MIRLSSTSSFPQISSVRPRFGQTRDSSTFVNTTRTKTAEVPTSLFSRLPFIGRLTRQRVGFGLAGTLALLVAGKYGWYPETTGIALSKTAHRLSQAADQLFAVIPRPSLPESPPPPPPAQKLVRTAQSWLSTARKTVIGLSSLLGIGGLALLIPRNPNIWNGFADRAGGTLPPHRPPLYLLGDRRSDRMSRVAERRISPNALPTATAALGYAEWKDQFLKHFQALVENVWDEQEKKEILKQEYRQLALKYHTDKNPNANQNAFKALQEAYTDPELQEGADPFDFLAETVRKYRSQQEQQANQVPTLVASEIKPAFEGMDDYSKAEALFNFEECLRVSALAEKREIKRIEACQAHIEKLRNYLSHPQAEDKSRYQEALNDYQEEVRALSQRNRSEERINAMREFLNAPEILNHLKAVKYRPAAHNDGRTMILDYDFGDDLGSLLIDDTEDNFEKLRNLYGQRAPLPVAAMQHFTKAASGSARGWKLERRTETP